jgi:glyoxylate reductase
VVIINTARGAVMEEDALVKALESGQISSVGLDVYEEEPKVHPGLLKNPNVMLLPHLGTYTVETMEKMEAWTIGNLKSVVQSAKLLSPVPEQADL